MISLGATDIRVCPLGVGVWQWGERIYWGYGREYGEADVRAAYAVSRAAGLNLFDTAEFYGFGASERLLGKFVHEAGDRNKVVIATKYLPFPWRLRRQAFARAMRGSLTRLGFEKVDLYQLHWPLPPLRIDRWADGLAEMVEQGFTRAVGVSNYDAPQMLRTQELLAKRGIPLASNQVAYSLLQRAPERTGLLDACSEANITLIAYAPLAAGALTGKYLDGPLPRGWRARRVRRNLAGAEPVVRLAQETGAAHGGKTPGQVALNWLLCKGAVPIPGAKTARQAVENAGALGWRLTDDEVARLDEATAAF